MPIVRLASLIIFSFVRSTESYALPSDYHCKSNGVPLPPWFTSVWLSLNRVRPQSSNDFERNYLRYPLLLILASTRILVRVQTPGIRGTVISYLLSIFFIPFIFSPDKNMYCITESKKKRSIVRKKRIIGKFRISEKTNRDSCKKKKKRKKKKRTNGNSKARLIERKTLTIILYPKDQVLYEFFRDSNFHPFVLFVGR